MTCQALPAAASTAAPPARLSTPSAMTSRGPRRRGRALAIATMGLSSAGIVIPLPVTLLIERFGWRAAWLALAAIVLVLGLAATAAMRRRPEDYGLAPDGVALPRAGHALRDTSTNEISLGARAATRTPA